MLLEVQCQSRLWEGKLVELASGQARKGKGRTGFSHLLPKYTLPVKDVCLAQATVPKVTTLTTLYLLLEPHPDLAG